VENTPLGRTGITVSRLCLGGWQPAGWQSSNEKSFTETIRTALEAGINFFDTAEEYGRGSSETLLGQALKDCRDRVVITTKFLHLKQPADIRKSLENSLRRLQTDYVDLYLQHWPPKAPPLDNAISELEALKAEGKIRAFGVSNWTEPEWEEIDNPGRIDCLQPCYSLLWRQIEKNVLPLCQKHGIAITPYSPLCQGILSGRFKSETDLPTMKKDPRRRNRRLSKAEMPQTLSVIEVLEQIARKYEKTPAQTALRWMLQQEGIAAPIVGASSPAQLDENLGALGWKLETEDMQLLNETSWPLSQGLKPHDTLWNWHPRGRS